MEMEAEAVEEKKKEQQEVAEQKIKKTLDFQASIFFPHSCSYEILYADWTYLHW